MRPFHGRVWMPTRLKTICSDTNVIIAVQGQGIRPGFLYCADPAVSIVLQHKARLRPMHGLKRLRTARVICAGHAFVQDLRRGHYELALDFPNHRLPAVFPGLARTHLNQHIGPAVDRVRSSADATAPSQVVSKGLFVSNGGWARGGVGR